MDEGSATAHFAHRRGQYHEELVRLGVRVQHGTNLWQAIDRLRVAPVERRIELVFDGRSLQERKACVIDAQVDAVTFRGAERIQLARHAEQRVDVGHTHQAEAHPLAAHGVRFGMVGMQSQAGLAQVQRELGMHLFPLRTRDLQWQQLRPSQRFRLRQTCRTLRHELRMLLGITSTICAVGSENAELVGPQARHDGLFRRLLGFQAAVSAAVAVVLHSASPVGAEHAFEQGWRQRGR